MIAIVPLLFIIPTVAVAGVSGNQGTGGNSGAAHACQKNGYTTLQRTDGSRFASVDDCVRYAAQGNVLQPIPTPTPLSPTIRINFQSDPNTPAGTCSVVVFLAGFAPLTDVPVTRPEINLTVTLTTDTAGDAQGVLGIVPMDDSAVTVFADGLSATAAPVTC